MAKLDHKQSYCGTCKYWENHSRTINMWGQITIPDNNSQGKCQADNTEMITDCKYTCPSQKSIDRPLNNQRNYYK